VQDNKDGAVGGSEHETARIVSESGKCADLLNRAGYFLWSQRVILQEKGRAIKTWLGLLQM